MHAVARHQHVAAARAEGAPGPPVDEAGHDGTLVLHEPDQVVAAVVMLGTQPLDHRGVEQPQQPAPVHRDLGPAEARRHAPGLTPDALAVAVVHHQLTGADARGIELVEQAQLGQLADGVGKHVDAHAQLAQLADALVHLDVVDTGGMEAEGQRAATDAATRDHHRHDLTPSRQRIAAPVSDEPQLRSASGARQARGVVSPMADSQIVDNVSDAATRSAALVPGPSPSTNQR